MKASEIWFREMFDQLVRNAADAMRNKDKRHIVVNVGRADEYAKVEVSDTGPGIPAELRPHVFKSRIKSTTGLGVGLLFAQMIAENYGGRIQVAQTGEQGTTLEVLFPLAAR